MLIRINNDWYEFHTTVNCNKENEIPDFVESSLLPELHDNDRDEISIKTESSDGKEELDVKFLYNIQQRLEIASINIHENRPTIKQPTSKRQSNKTFHTSHESKNTKKKSIKKQEEAKIENQAKFVSTFVDHRPKSDLICDICKKVLRTIATLRNHMKNIHTNSKNERVTCSECGQTFSSLGNLNSHKRIHLKCKAFVCTYCGRGFNQLHNLKEHTNRHTGEKPYKCSQCDKSFGRKTNLTAHFRVHTGEKPFVCKIDGCERAYMFDIDLKRHKYSVHGIYTKKHYCPICEKVYSENKLLKKHLESHSTGLR